MTLVTFMDTQLEQSYTNVVYHFWEAPKFSLTGTVLPKGVFKVEVVMTYLLNTAYSDDLFLTCSSILLLTI